MPHASKDMVSAFHQYFELAEAVSDEDCREAYRLRYQTYCIEERYFDPKDHTGAEEYDEYDSHSAQLLLKHRPSGKNIGTVRLILDDPGSPGRRLQVEEHLVIDKTKLDLDILPRSQIAEISRFSVLKAFSRRKHERPLVAQSGDTCMGPERRKFPDPALALIIGVIRLCMQKQVEHVLMCMTPGLSRLLKLYGFSMQAVGPLGEYYGRRRPYYTRTSETLAHLCEQHPQVWQLVMEGQHADFAEKQDGE